MSNIKPNIYYLDDANPDFPVWSEFRTLKNSYKYTFKTYYDHIDKIILFIGNGYTGNILLY